MKTDPFDPLETPTRVRYGVLAFLCALSFVLYIDRVCISQAVPVIQEDLHLTNTDMSYVLSAFILAYGLFEVPTGRWGDKYGSRGVLVRIVLWWSAFTALTGCVPYIAWQGGVLSLGLMVLVRFLFGAGEAGALPNAVRVVARWFPAGRRGAVQGLVATSTLVGGAATPSLAALLIGTVGWRWSFVLFGALGGYERGIAEIDPRLRWAASQVKSTNHRFENLRSEINGDWALTADLEHTRRWIDGRPEERTLRITHVCRFEDGEWRIFYRHADVYRPPAR